MKTLRVPRECFLIQILALGLMCGCGTVEIVEEADAEVAAGNMSAEEAEAKMIAIKKKKSGVNAKSETYLKKVWAQLQVQVAADNMSAEEARFKMGEIKKDIAEKTKNNAFKGQEYKLTSDSLEQEGVPKGRVTKHVLEESDIYPGTTHDYWIYIPAQYDKAKPACVMVFQDGKGYVHPESPVRAATVFDNLIHKGEMPVTIGIFINPGQKPSVKRSDISVPSLAGKTITTGSDNEVFTWVFGEAGELRLSGEKVGEGLGGQYEQDGPNVHIQIAGEEFQGIYDGKKLDISSSGDQRSIEYTSLGEGYARFLLEEILPEVGKDYNLTDEAAGRAICGMSDGGICAFTVAWERPDEFSKVISHIGSFVNIRGGHIYPSLIRKSRSNPKPIRVFLQTGENDLNIEVGDWKLGNLQMESALKFARYDYRFVMGDGGHDLKHGGAIFPETLRWLWRDYPGVKRARETAPPTKNSKLHCPPAPDAVGCDDQQRRPGPIGGGYAAFECELPAIYDGGFRES